MKIRLSEAIPSGELLESKGIPRIKVTYESKFSEQQKEESTKVDPKFLVVKARRLRRKAKLRAVYLQKLQDQGRFDPARPVKPDPERYEF